MSIVQGDKILKATHIFIKVFLIIIVVLNLSRENGDSKVTIQCEDVNVVWSIKVENRVVAYGQWPGLNCSKGG